MATFEDRLKQYQEVDEPTAKKKFIAEGIRKKFADEFDFSGLSDQEVIQRHYSRFGKDMKPEDYGKKLEEVYGKNYAAPAAPTETLGEKVQGAGEKVAEGAKEFGKGIVPFLVPELPKVAAAVLPATKAAAATVSKSIPFVSQAAFLGGHAINAAVDTQTAQALEKTASELPVPNVDEKAQEYFTKLQPGLSARGYSDDQIMQEARNRAQNVASGYQKTTESIDEQVAQAQQAATVQEPAHAATDAFFLGVGAPAIEGVLTKGMERLGLAPAARAAAVKAPSAIARVASHIKTGAIVGAPAIGVQGAIEHGVQAAAENKTPQEIGQALVKGGIEGAKMGAAGGAIIGATAGTLEAGLGATVGKAVLKKKFIETAAQAEVDNARLKGWQEYNAKQRDMAVKGENELRAAISKTADTFNPHTSRVPLEGDPADIATTIIQSRHGENAVMSEAGLRAATKIADQIKLYQDANVALKGNVNLPAEGVSGGTPVEGALEPNAPAPVQAPVERPGLPRMEGLEGTPAPTSAPVPLELASNAPTEPAPTVTPGQPLGPLERGGRPLPPPEEIAPRLEPKAKVEPAVTAPPAPPAPEKPAKTKPVKPVAPAAPVAPAPVPVEKPTEGAAPSAPPKEESVLKPSEPAQQAVSSPEASAAQSPAHAAAKSLEGLPHSAVEATPEGNLKITKLTKVGKPGGTAGDLEEIVKAADRHAVKIETDLVPPPGIKGGRIPLEKVIPWYEARGFKVVETTKIPEGNLATAKLVREPIGEHQTKVAEALEKAAEGARQRIAQKTGRLNSGFDPSLIGDYALELAADSFSKRLRSREEIATWAVQKWGEVVKPFLDKLIDTAQKHFVRMFKETGTAEKNLDELMALHESGKYGMGWYERTADWAKERFGEDADMFLRFLAITSANGQTESGAAMALKAFSQWKMGMPFTGFRGQSMVGQLERGVKGENLGEFTKIENFLRALRGDSNAVVLDRWMIDALGLKDKGGALREKDYRIYERVVRDLARDNGMTPRQFQAAIWEGARVRSIQTKEAKGGRQLSTKTGSARPLEDLVERKLGGLTPEQYAKETEGHLQMMQNLYQSLEPVRRGIVKDKKTGDWEADPEAPSGHTFDPVSFEPAAHKGYVVSLVSNSTARNHLYPARLLKFRDDVKPLIKEMEDRGLKPTIGVWQESNGEKPSGNFSIDLNIMVPDEAKALELGRLNRNFAIAKLGEGGAWEQNINTGYDPSVNGKQFLPPTDFLKRDAWHKQQMNRARAYVNKTLGNSGSLNVGDILKDERGFVQAVDTSAQEKKTATAILKNRGAQVDPSKLPVKSARSTPYWVAPDGKLYSVLDHEDVSDRVVKALKIKEKDTGYKGLGRWDNHAMLQRGFVRVQLFNNQVTAQLGAEPSGAVRQTLATMQKGRHFRGIVTSMDGTHESKLYESLNDLLRTEEKK
jgi:hypothetical protein